MAGKNNNAKAKKNLNVRESSEFATASLNAALERPKDGARALASWSPDEIIAARRAQMNGQFSLASSLADAMKTDDALYTAWRNRLAPQVAVGVAIDPAKSRGPALAIAEEAESLFGNDGAALSLETLVSHHGCLVDHGVSVLYQRTVPRDDGSRVDIELCHWPIRYVRWDETAQTFMARVMNAGDLRSSDRRWDEVPIVHGDGRWIVAKLREHEPWKIGAIVPGSIVWSRHALGMWDWSRGSKSHGDAKILGELPEGVALQSSDESGAKVLTDEAQALIALLDAFVDGSSQTGIKPSGAKVDFIQNTSTAWQVWKELTDKAEKAAARIYLGTDGTLGTQGGAPGVDVTALFGVATTIVQGDLSVISRSLKTGSIDVWTAINFGDSSLAPSRTYLLPDTEEEEDRRRTSERRKAFYADIREAQSLGFVVDKALVREVARVYDVDPPELPEAGADVAKPTIALAPTDLANVVKVNEARASAGLGPLLLADGAPDPDGALTISAFKAKQDAQIARTQAEAQASAQAQGQIDVAKATAPPTPPMADAARRARAAISASRSFRSHARRAPTSISTEILSEAIAAPLSGTYEDETLLWEGWIEPSNEAWIAFVTKDNMVAVWDHRASDGSTLGDPVVAPRRPR